MSPIYEPHILVILKMDNKRCVYKMIDDDDDDDDRPIIGKITYLCICIYIHMEVSINGGTPKHPFRIFHDFSTIQLSGIAIYGNHNASCWNQISSADIPKCIKH